MRYIYAFIILSICLNGSLYAQGESTVDTTQRQSVIAVIEKLFDGMRAGDSTVMRLTLHPEAHLQSSFTNKAGNPVLKNGSAEDWIKAVGTPHEEIYDEKIWSYHVQIDDNLAAVWTEYTFFLGEQLSHCGVNAFHLVKTIEGWKITHITDTRRRQNCIEKK